MTRYALAVLGGALLGRADALAELAYRRHARRSGEVVCYEGDYAYHDSTAAGIHDGDKCPRCGAAV